MFSSYRHHQNNLIFSQRFYYSNYQYYNDYQKIQQKYKNDLSKINFPINRKSKSTIFFMNNLWDNHNNKNENKKDKNNSMDIEDNNQCESTNSQIEIINKYNKLVYHANNTPIQKIFATIVQLYYENNYSQLKPIQQVNKKQTTQLVNLKYFIYDKYYQSSPINQHTIPKSATLPQSLISLKKPPSSLYQSHIRIQQHNQQQPSKQFISYQQHQYKQNNINILHNIFITQYQNLNIYYQAIQKLHELGKQQDIMYLERWNAFQDYIGYFVQHEFIKKDYKDNISNNQNNNNNYNNKLYDIKKHKKLMKKLYIFSMKVKYIIDRTLAADYFNSLFLQYSNIKKINRLFHPLVMGLRYTNTFYQSNHNNTQNPSKIHTNSLPRIVFLNLDGRQTPLNLRFARNIGSNLLYISVYKQPSYHYKKYQKMDNQFQSDIDTTFQNICECYSRMLISEAYPCKEIFINNNQQGQNEQMNQNSNNNDNSDNNNNKNNNINNNKVYANKSKMLLFPLYSQYLHKQHSQTRKARPTSFSKQSLPHTFPTLQSSQQIYFLFQSIIFSQIHQFNPSIIIISYNGFIDIKQQHFNQIIRNLTIMVDHKIILFPNLLDIKNGYKWGYMPGDEDDQDDQIIQENNQNNNSQNQQLLLSANQQNQQNQQEQQRQEQQQQQQQDIDQLKIRNIQVFQQFMSKYIPYKKFFSSLSHQHLFSNILMFMKISSGCYSMYNNRPLFSLLLLNPQLKYQLGKKYQYFQCLSQCKQFKDIYGKYQQKAIKSHQLEMLYENQGKKQIKQNRLENQLYENAIDYVIQEFINQYSQQRQQRQLYTNNNNNNNNNKNNNNNNSTRYILKQKKLFYRLQQLLSQHQQISSSSSYIQQQSCLQSQYSNNLSTNNNLSMFQTKQLYINTYLKKEKKRLLLENIAISYKHRKAYILQQQLTNNNSSISINSSSSSQGNLSGNNKLKQFRFYLYEDDSQQLTLQKYTQIIYDNKKKRIYIVNYKSNDDRHLILYGNMNFNQKKSMIKMQIVRQSQKQIINPIYLILQQIQQKIYGRQHNTNSYQQKQQMLKKDTILLNYSYCLVKDKLYLYWPQKFSIKDEIRHKLLNLQYKPQNTNIVIKIQWIDDNCTYQSLFINIDDYKNIPIVMPKIGCTSYELLTQAEDQFLIFGGIYDNQYDLFQLGQTVSIMTIKDSSRSFFVKNMPKYIQKSIKSSLYLSSTSIKKKNINFLNRLRPKQFYRIQKITDSQLNHNLNNLNNNNDDKILLSGGYGRQFTNFYNFYSYDSYVFNILTKQIQTKQLHKKRIIKLTKPVEIPASGKYFLLSNSQQINQEEQKYSDTIKDLFFYQHRFEKPSYKQSPLNNPRHQFQNINSSNLQQNMNNSHQSTLPATKLNPNNEIHAFLDEQYRINDYKTDTKKIYLFGFNRTIRQKIYMKFWSPEMYIFDGLQSHILHMSLKTQKHLNSTYNISNFLMPRQQDIISLCLDQDRLYILSASPIITSLDINNNKKYLLYQGNLSNMNDILHRQQIQMNQRYQFKKQKENNLKYKTIYVVDEKIYVIGGVAQWQEPKGYVGYESVCSNNNNSSNNTHTHNNTHNINSSITQIQDQNNNNNILKKPLKASYRQDYILQKCKNKYILKTRKVQCFHESIQMISPFIVKSNQLMYFYSIQQIQITTKPTQSNNINNTTISLKQHYKLKIQTFINQNISQSKFFTQLLKFFTYDSNKNNIQQIIPRLQQPKFVSISKYQPFSTSKFKDYLQKIIIRLKKYQQQQLEQKISEYVKKCQILLKQKNQELLYNTLIIQDKFFRDLILFIKPQTNPRDKDLEEEQLIKDLKIVYSMVNKLIIESLIEKVKVQHKQQQQQININISELSSPLLTPTSSLKKQNLLSQNFSRLSLAGQSTQQSSSLLYHFIIEDKSSNKIRYIGLGTLGSSTEIYFFRIRFKYQLCLCLNKTNQDQSFYYHPIANGFQEMDFKDKYGMYELFDKKQWQNVRRKENRLGSQVKM